jgi:splicing factor 3B subunit 3
MIASVEKNKLVYVLARNAQAELTISSPLEAHRPQTLTYALVGLDVGYENPIFAALELDYTDCDLDPSGQSYLDAEKMLVYYELDLGLNYVLRKWSEPVDRTANILFHVPGGSDGPSGVLVCGEDSITYRHHNQVPHRVPIPRRNDPSSNPEKKSYILSGVMHKMRGGFFFLLQSDEGDLFKVTIDLSKDGTGRPTGDVDGIVIKYFDTVPIATSMCILSKSAGFFVACENGNHHMYRVSSLADDDDEREFDSRDYPVDSTADLEPAYFRPRANENVSLIESVDSLHPLMGCQVLNLTNDDVPQIYSISGAGARSSFNILKNGIQTSELAESNLPGVPVRTWSTKVNKNDAYDSLIVISFSNSTLVMSIGDDVEEVTDTGLLSDRSTVAIQLLGEDSLIQVWPRGIRHIRADGTAKDWHAPKNRTVVAAATNEKQVAVALSSGELVYFEQDVDGTLAEYDERPDMNETVTCLSLGDVPEGRQRSPFLAVGCNDQTVRIFSLSHEDTLNRRSIQALSSPPTALLMMAMEDPSSGGNAMFLHIGLYSGVYLRTALDEVTGDLSDSRSRFLGAKAVKLSRVIVKKKPAVLALSTRPWLGYSDSQTRAFTLRRVDYVPMESASNFSSAQCEEGMIGFQGQALR